MFAGVVRVSSGRADAARDWLNHPNAWPRLADLVRGWLRPFGGTVLPLGTGGQPGAVVRVPTPSGSTKTTGGP
ncbi:hypothetical protein ACFPN7_34700 [Amycolatopsis halotolerans]|uniref:hypothetical protein n=1 Tax=Amycolatopsis halotolerans TaxID=330083 RepID=UPI00361786C0